MRENVGGTSRETVHVTVLYVLDYYLYLTLGEGYSPRSMTFLLADIPANVFTKFKNILIFGRFHGLKRGLIKQTLQLLFLDNSADFYPCFCFHQKNPPAPLVHMYLFCLKNECI